MSDTAYYILTAYIVLNVGVICYLALQEGGEDISKHGLTLPFTALFVIQMLGIYFQLR